MGSETKRDAAAQRELIGILRIADQVASPVRIAPPARRVALDVRRRKAADDSDADMWRREELHAAAPRRRELSLAWDRSCRRRCGDWSGGRVDAGKVRRAESAVDERHHVTVVRSEVVAEVAVV